MSLAFRATQRGTRSAQTHECQFFWMIQSQPTAFSRYTSLPPFPPPQRDRQEPDIVRSRQHLVNARDDLPGALDRSLALLDLVQEALTFLLRFFDQRR
jgi:hypothetical protein